MRACVRACVCVCVCVCVLCAGILRSPYGIETLMFVGSTEKLRQADFPDVQLHLMSILADWPSWLKLTPEVYHIAYIECKHHSLDLLPIPISQDAPPPPGLPLHTAYTRKSCLGIRSRPAVERRVVLEERFQKVFESG